MRAEDQEDENKKVDYADSPDESGKGDPSKSRFQRVDEAHVVNKGREALIDKHHPASQHFPCERRAERNAPARGSSRAGSQDGGLRGMGYAYSLWIES